MPVDSGMAFVVVVHLSPRHASGLPGLLQAATSIPVIAPEGPQPIEANHIYVISPDKLLSMNDGYLRVTAMEPTQGRQVAIDLFFRSLATVHRERAVAVVLWGGADGAAGLARIKEEGGTLVSGERCRRARAGHALRARTGHDFRNYKRATVLRRLERRLQVHGLRNLPAYRALLQGEPEEAQALLRDMLIGVTNLLARPGSLRRAAERGAAPDRRAQQWQLRTASAAGRGTCAAQRADRRRGQHRPPVGQGRALPAASRAASLPHQLPEPGRGRNCGWSCARRCSRPCRSGSSVEARRVKIEQ